MSRRRADATQYAKGLFNVAVAAADPEQVGAELDAFVGLLESQPDLRRVLQNPAMPRERKEAVLREVNRLSPVAPVLEKFLAILARDDSFTLLADIVSAYQARLRQHLQIVAVQVRSAVPLTAEQQAAVTRRLADLSGKRLHVSTVIDPSIVGGVVAQVGSVVYDGSVRRQLERLREQFIGRA